MRSSGETKTASYIWWTRDSVHESYWSDLNVTVADLMHDGLPTSVSNQLQNAAVETCGRKFSDQALLPKALYCSFVDLRDNKVSGSDVKLELVLSHCSTLL
jgi:hypothetical protein